MSGSGPRSRSLGKAVFRIEAVLVVHLLLLRVAQDVVRFLKLLEAVFRRFVAGVQVGMVLAREPPVGLADVLRAGIAADPESLVIILLLSGRHK
jgi:hypothetical protein